MTHTYDSNILDKHEYSITWMRFIILQLTDSSSKSIRKGIFKSTFVDAEIKSPNILCSC